jgi:CubicO group peptidase (beta-lactamase class C family)
MSHSDPIAKAMHAALEGGVFPGAVLLVCLRGRIVYHQAFGSAALTPAREPACLETIYDLASLTKPLATATAILCLVRDGRVSTDDPVQRHVEELKGSAVGEATVYHLLTHSAGLPAWRPLYERIAEEDRRTPGLLGGPGAVKMALALIKQEPLEAPPGARSVYSDLGFILLGVLVERAGGSALAAFCRRAVFEPMGASLSFRGSADAAFSDRSLVAPTEDDPWRGRLLRGEVHDENAYALGGAAGHAGLFGTASAVSAVVGHWLDAWKGRGSLLPADLVKRFTARQEGIAGSSWALGWDTPTVPSSSGSRFSPASFGHLGYTGTSVWVDPTIELEVVLLSNRVHPTRRNEAIKQFRPLIHDVIYDELAGGRQGTENS